MNENIRRIPRRAARPEPAETVRGGMDFPLLALTLMLLLFGLVMVFSASFPSAYYEGHSPAYYFIRQAGFAAFGAFLMIVCSRIPMATYRRYTVLIFLLSMAALALVPIIGTEANGARRWIDLKVFQFQPSEAVKLAVILMFANMICNTRAQMKTFKYGVLPYAAILIAIIGLLALEPHLSCAIIICALAAVMLFVGGMRWQYLVGAVGAGAALIYVASKTMSYVQERIAVWRDPFGPAIGDPLYDKAYQIKQSLWAVGSGGFTGLGLGEGRQKFLYLPEEHNDYIFAILCEELGLIGALAVLALFALLICRGYWIALHTPDRYSFLVAVGVTTLLAVQVLLNVAVVTNFIPCTGISLPFFSYGGTALVLQLAEMGILLSISREIPARRST